MATLSMRDNLQSLYLLMDKLYLRNPTSGNSLAISTPPPPPGRSASPSSSASRLRSSATGVTWRH
jgi:hypothetical protein